MVWKLAFFFFFFQNSETQKWFLSSVKWAEESWPPRLCLWCFYLATWHVAGTGWPSESGRYGKASVWSEVIRLSSYKRLLGRLINGARRLWSLYSQHYYHLCTLWCCQALLCVEAWMQQKLKSQWNLSNRPSLQFIIRFLLWSIWTKSGAELSKILMLIFYCGQCGYVNNISVVCLWLWREKCQFEGNSSLLLYLPLFMSSWKACTLIDVVHWKPILH